MRTLLSGVDGILVKDVKPLPVAPLFLLETRSCPGYPASEQASWFILLGLEKQLKMVKILGALPPIWET